MDVKGLHCQLVSAQDCGEEVLAVLVDRHVELDIFRFVLARLELQVCCAPACECDWCNMVGSPFFMKKCHSNPHIQLLLSGCCPSWAFHWHSITCILENTA